MKALEDRYRRLLLAYPADYRAERGDEILGTLMEAARSDQHRPTLRERRSLIMGGIRIRLAAQHRLSTTMNWRLATMLAGVLMIGLFPPPSFGWEGVGTLSSDPTDATRHWHYTFDVNWPMLIGSLMVMAVVVSVWFARPRTLLVLAPAAAAVSVGTGASAITVIDAGILIALALLTMGAPRMPRAWLGLYAMVVLGNAVPALLPNGLPGISPIVLMIVLIGTLIWALLDARPFIAVTLAALMAVTIAMISATVAGHGALRPTLLVTYLLLIGVAILLGAPAAWRLRRQSAL